MYVGLFDRPFVPHNLCQSHGCPVPLINFHNAPRFRLLTSSGSKKNESKYSTWVWVSPRLHTHAKHELRFPPLLHTSYIRDGRPAPLCKYIFSGCYANINPGVCLVKAQLVLAAELGPETNSRASLWVLNRSSTTPSKIVASQNVSIDKQNGCVWYCWQFLLLPRVKETH
jgi:hypothetical protein